MKPVFFSLILLLPVTSFGQGSYIDGYIIKPHGDTVWGYIKYPDYNRWVRCPEYIKFKPSSDTHKVLEFTPKTIREFHVTDHETYIAYAGLVSADGNVYPITGFKLDTSKKQDTIFLKQVIKGKPLSLYYHNDRFKTRFFIRENDGPLVELKYYLYFQNENNLVTRPVYTGQLMSLANKYTSENGKLIKKIPEMRFIQADIEDFINELNQAAQHH